MSNFDKKIRFTRDHLCPICGGYNSMPRGKGKRCHGFQSESGEWAHCSRREKAGTLDLNANSDTYAHHLIGDCRCGVRHDSNPESNKDNAQTDRRIAKTYDYWDESGNLRYQVVRFEPKGFSQRRLDGKGGWIWNLEGVERVLYQLPELIQAINDGATEAFVAEGEKDVDLLRNLGFLATCNSEGAGKWHPKFAEYFAGLDVVVLADNDDSGRKHAHQVADTLLLVSRSVKLVTLPDLSEKADVSDWFEAGHTVEQFREFVSPHPIYSMMRNETFPVRTAKEIGEMTPETPDWICSGLLAKGSVTELVGKAKTAGKTTLTMHMLKSIEDDRSFLGMRTRKAKILYMTEERWGTYREALSRGGLLNSNCLNAVSFYEVSSNLKWTEKVDLAITQARVIGAEVIVVDTIGHWSGLKGETENQSGAGLEAMMPLQYAAAQGFAVLALRHGNKAGGDVGDVGRGSSAITGSVDISLLLTRVATGDNAPNRRELKGIGRFDATPTSLLIELQDGLYIPIGDSSDARRLDARRLILENLATDESDAVSPNEMLKIIGDKSMKSTLERELKALLDDGEIKRVGEGRRGQPYRYFKPETHFSSYIYKGEKNRNSNGYSSSPIVQTLEHWGAIVVEVKDIKTDEPTD